MIPTARISWNMGEDGVATIYAHLENGTGFDLLDIYRRPLIELGGMTKETAQAFQAFAAERICAAWNNDKSASQIALDHKIDPALSATGTLTEWGQGHNAACDQIAHEIMRRFKF
jgi:hypothetical protein